MKGKGWLVALGAGLLVGLASWVGWRLCRSGDEPLWPLAVPAGDQEIAWLMPATSLSSWDRFVEAVRLLVSESGGSLVWVSDVQRSRAHQDIPELALQYQGSRARLWIRWYKLTGDYSAKHWIWSLLQRKPKPLAIIGGNTSDRAVELVRLLRERHEQDPDTPALLLTTATADETEVYSGAGLTDLLSVYPGRTFRFCFTNRQMAEALVDFVASRPTWLPTQRIWDAITWRDDPYSEDFANRISDALRGRELGWLRKSVVPYSVGDTLLPSEREREVLEEDLIATWAQGGHSPHVLVLPTVERVSRRVLIGLIQAAPWVAERLTVVVGDSMSFNVVCRDRRLLWPTELLPVRVLLFAHEEPVRWTGESLRPWAEVAESVLEGASWLHGIVPTASTSLAISVSRESASDDLLLWVRILRGLKHAAWGSAAIERSGIAADWQASAQPMASATREFIARLRDYRDELGELFFDESGNRRGGAGEYVICVEVWRPVNRLATWSVVEVWHSQRADKGQRSWQLRYRWLMPRDS